MIRNSVYQSTINFDVTGKDLPEILADMLVCLLPFANIPSSLLITVVNNNEHLFVKLSINEKNVLLTVFTFLFVPPSLFMSLL